MAKQIKVERETYTKNGKEFFSYFIAGNVRGKTIKAVVVPPDIGGYEVLDIVFDTAMEAELVITPYEMKDANGDVISGNTYSVRSCDADGVVYECKIKPFRQSDKTKLNMLVR